MESDSYKRNNKNNNSQDELDNEQKLVKQFDSAAAASSSSYQTQQQQYFNRVNSNRRSVVKNETNSAVSVWPTAAAAATLATNTNQSIKSMFTDQIFKVKLAKCSSKQPNDQALGIHVIPTYDLDTQKDMGLIIQRIEPNGRVYRDARMRVGDRIVEINGTSLIGIDFKSAQIILRDAIQQSNDLARNVSLEFKLVRSQSNLNVEQQYASEQQERPEYEAYDEEQEEINERPIEIEPIGQQIDGENEDSYENNKENNTVANTNNNMSFNHLSSINMNALNTKKMGKIITVQLVKGPQGLGFKLAARDNCASGEFSPIYIKNILPKGAAITDGRLQRGDRLIEVDKMDMTKTTLHEAVNILRNTKLGACVELVVSRQILPNLNNSQTENSYNTSNLIQQQQQNNSNNTNEYHSPHKQLLPREISNETDNTNVFLENDANQDLSVSRRQLLTFEIALNDTGSAGLGVSVKGKTKRIEENDCSVDLGIFIKIVINGGAAFKDGRLRPNDQLININGFSLLGKSNEEAMLILREAMQVESKPGHIQLTVSRKVKSNSCNNINEQALPVASPIRTKLIIEDELVHKLKRDSSESPEPYRLIEKPVVKVINHSTTSPLKPHQIINKINQSSSTPITMSSGRNKKEENSARFSRDAPSRRSMSEKRTKIGSGSINKSQTSNSISNSRFNRNTVNQSSLIDTYSSQAKRSQTLMGINGATLNPRSSLMANPQEFRTLNKNFKIKSQINTHFGPNQLRVKDLNTIISQESLLSQNNSIKKQNVIASDSKANLDSNRMGSFESVLSQTVTVSSSTSNTVKEQENLPVRQKSTVNSAQIQQPYRDTKPIENQMSNNHRRSISMETFQSDHLETAGLVHQQPINNHLASTQTNHYNKFGTISGFSNLKLTDTHSNIVSANSNINNTDNNQYTNKTYLSTNYNNDLKVMNLALNSNAANSVINTNAVSASLDANSRFRAINRSFRTAVDKSFDMPSNSEMSDEGNQIKIESQQQLSGKQKTTQNKKSIIETFQSLFKNKKNQPNAPNNKQTETTTAAVAHNALATTVTNEHLSNKQSKTIELINYQKKNFDDVNYKNIYAVKPTNGFDQLANNIQTNNNTNFELTNFNRQLETLIDNNTLYTQYKPQSSSSTTNEITFSGTGISSSSSTSSASSTSATIMPRSTISGFNSNNRRDCLFYHSSDNYRLNSIYQMNQQYSNHVSRSMYRPLNRIENNNHTPLLQTIPQEKPAVHETSVVIKHAAPFNGSKQVHTVSDLFKEEEYVLFNGSESKFERNNLNQLSTKSQPPLNYNETRIMYNNYVSSSNHNRHHQTFNANIPNPAEV